MFGSTRTELAAPPSPPGLAVGPAHHGCRHLGGARCCPNPLAGELGWQPGPRFPPGRWQLVLRGRKHPSASRVVDTRFRATPFSSLPRRGPGAGTAVQTGSETPRHGTGKTRRGGRDGHGGFGALGYGRAMPASSPGLAAAMGGCGVLGVREELLASRHQPRREGRVARQRGRVQVPSPPSQGFSPLGMF